MTYTFDAELWIWDARRSDGWTFVTLPDEATDELRIRGHAKGFGSVRVEVTLGNSIWRTSVFPDKSSGRYVLPIKKSVRRAEAIAAGDRAELSVEPLPE